MCGRCFRRLFQALTKSFSSLVTRLKTVESFMSLIHFSWKHSFLLVLAGSSCQSLSLVVACFEANFLSILLSCWGGSHSSAKTNKSHGILVHLGAVLGLCCGWLGPVLGFSWAQLQASRSSLEPNLALMAASWVELGASWAALGRLLGSTWSSWTPLGLNFELLDAS